MHVAVHKGHSASSSPFTCWPYANSRIRDRTRPTAIGIQIQISHCARVPAPVTGFTFSRRSRRNPLHLSPLSQHEDTCPPFKQTERKRKGEKKREKSEKKNNNNTRARRGLVSGPEATIGKFEIERDQPARVLTVEVQASRNIMGRQLPHRELEPSHPFHRPLPFFPDRVSILVLPGRLARNNETVETLARDGY